MKRGQVARHVVPEVDRVEVELRAAFPPGFGRPCQVLQQILFGLPNSIAAGLAAEGFQHRVGLVVAAEDTAHAAADVSHETLRISPGRATP